MKEMSLLFVGDVMLGRGVGRINAHRPSGWLWEPWRNCGLSFDGVIGNLECLLTERGRANAESASAFRAPERLIEGSGFSALSLANNHVRDFGDVGIEDTVAALRRRSIQPLGVGRTALEAHQPYFVVGKDGTRVAVVAGTSMRNVIGNRGEWQVASVESMIEHCAELGHCADVKIAFVHMGYERVATVAPEARNLARRLIERGFDLVVGNHAHVIQACETIGESHAYYSLGDFVFDSRDPSRLYSLGLEASFSGGSLKQTTVLGFSKTADLRPCLADAEAAAAIRQQVESLSAQLKADKTGERFFEEASQDYLGRQWRDIKRVARKSGIRGLVAGKLRRARLSHLRLLLCALRSSLSRTRL